MRQFTKANQGSGEVELGGRKECKVNTNITMSDIRSRGYHGVVRIEFTLCNKIITDRTTLPAPNETEKSDATNIQGDFQQFGFQTLNDLESMLNDSATADVAIKVTLGAEKIFQCHKFILMGKVKYSMNIHLNNCIDIDLLKSFLIDSLTLARSPVFRAMFACQMTEANDNVVVIQDISAPTMEHFLSFVYCGHFQDESWIQCLPNLTYVGHKVRFCFIIAYQSNENKFSWTSLLNARIHLSSMKWLLLSSFATCT